MLSWLKEELTVVKERDPAVKSSLEVIVCYPGFHAILFHRMAHILYRARLFVLARLISQVSRFLTGIEIHPGAKIGKGLFIDHGSGVVIGETAEVGNNVTLYQGVTLGGTGKEKGKRHPTLEDNVVVGAGAKILGSMTIGEGAKIGAGSVVVDAVAPGSTVVGIPGRVVKRHGKRVIGVDLEHGNLPDPVADAFAQMQREIAALKERVEYLEGKDRHKTA